MKNKRLFFLGLMLTMAVFCCAEALAIKASPQYESYDFTNISVAEALRTIGQDSGIIIEAPFDQLQEIVQKSYENVSIDQIIKDIMKGRNHAIVWHYLDQEVVAISIRLVPARVNQTALSPTVQSFKKPGGIPLLTGSPSP